MFIARGFEHNYAAEVKKTQINTFDRPNTDYMEVVYRL